MASSFWDSLPKPFFALAPMADVTDAAFRTLVARFGKPDVMWTEFVSADGLCLAPEEGRKKLLKAFDYTEAERPIVAQIFGSKPAYIEQASRLVADLGFDGVDINMGCPDKTIEKQCAGAALIKNPPLAREIIQAARAGASSGARKIPVSVKTRVGFNKVELETWIPELLKENIAALTIHARTRKEMSKVPANWDYVKRAVQLRDEMKLNTLIIGNGDVKTLEEGKRRVAETGCDGVMIGRGVFGNPWLFADKKTISTKERLEALMKLSFLFEGKLTGFKNFAVLKKHFKAFVEGFDGAKELRVRLMETENAMQVEEIVREFLIDKADNLG